MTLPMTLHDTATALLRLLPAETAHRTALWGLAHGLGPRAAADGHAALAQTLWGRRFPNPFGIAAGFDKNGVALAGALAIGTGFAEIGGVTPLAQPGNPRPRLFRLAEDRAAINRMGFNNDGMDAVAARHAAFRASGRDDGRVVGVNLAANSASGDPEADFERLVKGFAPLADYLTLDISCPNSANGQIFLEPARLAGLLRRVVPLRAAAATATRPAPLLIAKLAPDIDEARALTLVDLLVAAGIDGMIVSNTTTARPASLRSAHAGERGGLSGPPLFAMSTALLARVRRHTGGRLPLIGVGGVASVDDAWAKIRAGASLVQLYTALIYEGPGLIARLKAGLAARLAAEGFTSLAEAVGTGG
ncbi:MAG: quinone-dependent dihydroorotate dehydrogenase [Alphaproteobacteria bacterium]